MSQTRRVPVTKKQWDGAAADYELGTKHLRQIARELGVSPATVSREFQRRGCQKASRVQEYVEEFLARLAAEEEEKARVKGAAKAAAEAARARFVEEFFDASERGLGDLELSRIDRDLQLALREADAMVERMLAEARQTSYRSC